MFEAYGLINWKNKPSTATPKSAENFNHMDRGIKDVSDYVRKNLTAEGVDFKFGFEDGKPGCYIPDESTGADTFYPFNSGGGGFTQECEADVGSYIVDIEYFEENCVACLGYECVDGGEEFPIDVEEN